MKGLFACLIIFSFLCSCTTKVEIERPYKVMVEMRHVEQPKNRNDSKLPDFRRLCDSELEKQCFVSFKIRNPEIAEPKEKITDLIRGGWGPNDPGLYVETGITVLYDKLGVIRAEDDNGVIGELKVLVPSPGPGKLPAYIFTQIEEPRYVALNPHLIEDAENKEKK